MIFQYNFYRILRKCKSIQHLWKIRFVRNYYHYLSKGNIKIHHNCEIGSNFTIHSDLSNPKLDIGKGTRFRDSCKLRIERNGVFSIGENCFFNNNFSATCLLSISIGDNTQFGENVLIYDSNHKYSDIHTLISKQGYSLAEVKIGSNCWIGSGVIILKGTEIGDNCVIGAGCIIHKSVKANSVVIASQKIEHKGSSHSNVST